jgi:phosphate-selective porin OprO and OprP
MQLNRKSWFTVMASLGLFCSAATAQPPAPPVPSQSSPVSQSLPTPKGLIRLQAVVSPPMPGIEPEPLPGAAPTDCCPVDGGVSPIPATQSDGPRALTASWADGLRFRSLDDTFHLHVGGNVQIDSNWLIGPQSAFALPGGGANGVGNASATMVRRARLRIDGGIWDQVDYVIEYDFANANNDTGSGQPPSFGNIAGSPAPINVWMQLRDVPFLGNVRFGNQGKPIGFTNQVYQGFLPFIERPDIWDAFQGTDDNGFSIGLTARNHTDDELVTWQYGVYRPLTNNFAIGLNKMQWGGRVTGLPVFADDGRELIHLGFGTLDGEVVQDQLRDRTRTLFFNAPGYAVPVLANTGTLGGSRQYTLGPEFAAVLGSWTFQSEWNCQFLTQASSSQGQSVGTAFFHGGYVEVLYFLTGEYQSYDKEAGCFGRVVPNQNLRMKRGEGVTGWGAWQVAARLSYLDLNDKAIQGGTLYDCTLGLNWFWNPNMKVQFNAIAEHRDQQGVTPGWISGVGIRGSYDF